MRIAGPMPTLRAILLIGAMAAAICLSLSSAVIAEDVVTLRGKLPHERVQKRGEIVDWLGGQLRLRGALDREELAPGERVVSVQTARSESHELAQRLHREGKLADAIKAYYAARGEEPRGWVQRELSAELAVTLLESGQPHLAGEEFLSITAADPATHLFAAIPLAWTNARLEGPALERARAWLTSQDPTTRLLGASWLLTSEDRSRAIAELERLRTASDRRLAAAAEIQLWRTRIVTVTPEDIVRWKTAAGKVPAELRGVAWYQIGQALARHKQPEEAALAFLQTALSYNRQRAMAADALVAAAGQLERLGRQEQAADLYRETLRDYAEAPAAAVAQARLAALQEQAQTP